MRIRPGRCAHSALAILAADGPMSAGDFGAMLWRDKKRGRTVSSNGGGDYAAQCFLGKLKKAGYVQHAQSEGSSLWELSTDGKAAIAKATQTPQPTRR